MSRTSCWTRIVDAREASEGGRHRRGGARLLLRQEPARETAGGVPPAHRGGAADRPAADRAQPRCRRGHRGAAARGRGEGRPQGRDPLLHRDPVSGGRGAGDGLLHLALRHRHLQERRGAAARSRRRCRSTGCWWRRTRPILRRCRCAASATSRASCATPRPMSRTCSACRSTNWRRAPPPISTLCSTRRRRRVKVTILGCGGSGGVPLLGPHWGDCNPDNPEEPAPSRLDRAAAR